MLHNWRYYNKKIKHPIGVKPPSSFGFNFVAARDQATVEPELENCSFTINFKGIFSVQQSKTCVNSEHGESYV